MLQIVYFTGKDEFIEFIESQQTENLFVTASPAKADTIRSSLKDPLRSDVITISRFTADLASMLWPMLENRPKIKKKAELFLNFGILKNKYLPWLTFEDFKDAYGVFSDLRSFSLQYEVISQVLAEESENVRLAVELFWKLLDLTGDIDEHGAYAQLAEQLRSADEYEVFKNKNLIFWGFQHLNGQQIDLIKALAIRYRVIIPFPAKLENSLRPTDWLSWLLDQATEIVRPAGVNLKPSLEANLIPINSREIASTLKNKLEKHDQVILGVSKLNPGHSSLIPYNSVNFKIPLSLIDNEISQLHDEIEQISKALSLQDLKEWLKQRKRNSSLKMLKAIQLFEDSCEYFLDVTDELIIIDHFLLKLIREVSLLNQPRNYLIPLLSKEADVELLDLSSIDQIHGKGRVFICIDEKFQDILSLTSKYSEDIQKYLSPIGPLKRSELDLQFKKWEMESLIEKHNIIFLMPQDVLKHNLIWKKILEDVSFTKNITTNRNEIKKEKIDWNLGKKFSGDFSASRLQTYLDCPKKFYFSYVEKIFPNIKLKKDIDPKISGTIVHKIIEEFIKLKGASEFDLSFTRTIFDAFVQQEQLSLPFEVYQQRLIQLHHRAHNGLEFLKSIEKNLNVSITWEIEKKFEMNDRKLKGQIDCIGETENHLFLLDFKSTKSAASSFKEIEDFESIQLWIYAQAARRMNMKNSKLPIVFGYIVLDDPEDSLIISDDEEILNNFKTLKLSRTKKIDDFEDALGRSQQFTDSLMLKIIEDSSFVIKPRKSEVCFFCELNPICSRKETCL